MHLPHSNKLLVPALPTEISAAAHYGTALAHLNPMLLS